jgi:hypothetical protein
VPVDAQSRYRVKSAERTKKEKSAPPGPHLFLVSLKSQRAALYANGALVAQTPISSGTASHPTPTGVFSVIQKNRHHRSNIYSGAPMPFMQRLTWSGIALHQGQLPGYPASHGCIRLPGDFASFLWRTTRLGARVIITHDEIAPSDISHAKLFQPKPRTRVADAAPALRRSIETDIAANTLTGTATDATAGDREGPDPEAARPDDAATGISAAALSDIPKSILASYFDTLEAKARKPTPAGPVSIFISRKDKQLYVRQGMQALFNVPVTLRDEQTAVGTHVFTALARTRPALDRGGHTERLKGRAQDRRAGAQDRLPLRLLWPPHSGARSGAPAGPADRCPAAPARCRCRARPARPAAGCCRSRLRIRDRGRHPDRVGPRSQS